MEIDCLRCHGNGWAGLKRRTGGGEEGVLDHHGDDWRMPILTVGGVMCDVGESVQNPERGDRSPLPPSVLPPQWAGPTHCHGNQWRRAV